MADTNVEQKSHLAIVDKIRTTAPAAIGELPFVKDKFIANYNATHRTKNGELIYHRQLMHFKQIIGGNEKLKTADPFSLYACFLTAAVNGDSLDPQDEETYLIPIGGKAYLWPQVKSRVKRLRNSGQVRFLDQAQLVYQGDEFHVESGRVMRHVEKFQSGIIIAGYVRFVLDEKGTDKYFIYRKSDWEAWKKKSQSPGGDNWAGGEGGQPLAAFLRTKLIKHACSDKSWSSGRFAPDVEQFNVEIDEPDETGIESGNPAPEQNANQNAALPESTQGNSYAPVDNAPTNTTVVDIPDEEGDAY